ncbi:MAG: NfeD family protein [Deltaproteobacteria bacterium]|nr:NfeD family protein [Deltaproteobacteria bacterium]
MPELSFSPAVVWAIVGLALIILELATFTFVLIFLGLGAIITAALTYAGATPDTNTQLIAFSASSLLLLVVLRKTARSLFAATGAPLSDDIGQRCEVTRVIPRGGEGEIRHRGSIWTAISDAPEEIAEGTSVEIIAIEGIRVKVKKVG